MLFANYIKISLFELEDSVLDKAHEELTQVT
jgi:hypothetical protein